MTQKPVAQDPVTQDPLTQDPVAKAARPASRPEGAAPLVPVQEPFTAPVTRSDLPGRYTPPDPAEGIWRLRDRVIAGQPVRPGRGYLVIGRRHLLAQFVAPGTEPDLPLLRAGTYTWKRIDELGSVRLTGLFGYFNDGAGDIHIEREGAMVMRRIQLLDGSLRLHQGAGGWLEFVRVE